MEQTRRSNPFFMLVDVRIGSLIEAIGVDACLFEVTVRTRHYTTVVKFSLFELIDFCKEAHPDAHKYFKSVRKRIPGPGDQNETMLALIMEDEYDMTYLIGDYIDKRSNIEWFHQEFGSKDEEVEEEETLSDMELAMEAMTPEERLALFAPLREANERDAQLANELMQCLNDKVLEICPELADSSEKTQMKLNRILSKASDKVARKVSYLD
jgi:hypothetical protein